MINLPIFGTGSAKLCLLLVLVCILPIATSNIIMAQSSAASGRIEGTIVDGRSPHYQRICHRSQRYSKDICHTAIRLDRSLWLSIYCSRTL
jgi:hypothetical protein